MSSHVLIYPGAGEGAKRRDPVLGGILEHVLPDGRMVIKLHPWSRLDGYIAAYRGVASVVDTIVAHPNNVCGDSAVATHPEIVLPKKLTEPPVLFPRLKMKPPVADGPNGPLPDEEWVKYLGPARTRTIVDAEVLRSFGLTRPTVTIRRPPTGDPEDLLSPLDYFRKKMLD